MTTTDARKRINERSDEVTDNRVTITLSDGTTREVHPDTPVTCAVWGVDTAHAASGGGETVISIFEPTREHWTPYQPWMRDVLADDARVSWHEGGDDYRAPFVHRHQLAHEWDLRVHPDDVPERPAEDEAHRTLRLAIIDEWGGRPDNHFNLADSAARAAREHIEASRPPETDWHGLYLTARRKREKAEVGRVIEREGEWYGWYVELSEQMDEVAQDIRITAAERDEWKARHAALRADVERTRGINAGAELTFADEVIRGILDRDDERGQA